MVEERPEAMVTRGWLLFEDLTFHSLADGSEPKGPHVLGSMLGSEFRADSEIMGARTEPLKGMVTEKGYLELRTRRFFELDSEAKPEPPYVLGLISREHTAFFPTGELITGNQAFLESSNGP